MHQSLASETLKRDPPDQRYDAGRKAAALHRPGAGRAPRAAGEPARNPRPGAAADRLRRRLPAFEAGGAGRGSIAVEKDGLVIKPRCSKTDQEGQGRQLARPYGPKPETC